MIDKSTNRREFLKISALSCLSLGVASCGLIHYDSNNLKIIYDQDSLLPKFTDGIELPKGYHYQVLISWGDSIFNNADFDMNNPLAKGNNIKKCFGYNNDFCAYFPINNSSEHGLLCVNHEYVNPELMFSSDFLKNNYPAAAQIMLDSMGCSIIEIYKKNNHWNIVRNSHFNRRITSDTQCNISGAASDSPRLFSSFSPSHQSFGTFANCSGGRTPWNSFLTAEENFNNMFGGDFTNSPEAGNLRRLGFSSKSKWHFEKYFPRFDLKKNLNEANKFGYIVEIDPFNPKLPPIKRTSLGRFKHETATTHLDNSGHIVVYMGDDENFQYLYKFVSKDKFDPANPDNHRKLLDEGTLMVAKFFDNGEMEWLPLIYGENLLNDDNGFYNQADVIIETRKAAEIVGATKLDRPEGIAISPIDDLVCISLTNNHARLIQDAVNHDSPNIHGYILQINPPSGNHCARSGNWKILLRAGNYYEKSALSNPDNLTFDKSGNLWVATDGMPQSRGVSDSLFKIDIKNGNSRRLLNSPHGSEICSPEFTPDQKHLFLSIQHPGEGSTFDNPSTRWPKFYKDCPPLPSIIVIEKTSGSNNKNHL